MPGTLQFADPTRAASLSKTLFLSVDPGTRNPAFALFLDGRCLIARRTKVPGKLAKLDPVERCRRIARLVADDVRLELVRIFGAGPRTPQILATEMPQVYTREKSKGDPNDLILLAVMLGALAAELGLEVVSAKPKDWCMIPKREREFKDPWLSPRGHVFRSRLLPGEFEVIESTHDALDAWGIGAKILYRLEKNLVGTTRRPSGSPTGRPRIT